MNNYDNYYEDYSDDVWGQMKMKDNYADYKLMPSTMTGDVDSLLIDALDFIIIVILILVGLHILFGYVIPFVSNGLNYDINLVVGWLNKFTPTVSSYLPTMK